MIKSGLVNRLPLTNLIILAVILVFLTLVPISGMSFSWIQILFTFCIYLSMAQMWNLLAGYGGLVALGQSAFIGVATYTLAIIFWAGSQMPIVVAMILGGLVAVIFAVILSVPVFRLGGLYFAIGTLIIPEVLRYWFNTWTPDPAGRVGAGAGFAIRTPGMSLTDFYWIALGVAVIATLVTLVILNSKFGLGIKAIRDDTIAAASSGINVFRMKFYLFLIAAFVTGLAGVTYYLFVGHLEPRSAFSVGWTMHMIIPVVLGGMGTFWGPFVGTTIFVILYFFLSDMPTIHLLIKGVIVVVFLLAMPDGIVGMFSKVKLPFKRFRSTN